MGIRAVGVEPGLTSLVLFLSIAIDASGPAFALADATALEPILSIPGQEAQTVLASVNSTPTRRGTSSSEAGVLIYIWTRAMTERPRCRMFALLYHCIHPNHPHQRQGRPLVKEVHIAQERTSTRTLR
ncbi:hypothetical protein C8Q73DRAFT_674624 [Cubamyces lactineus]|nr:hypothetical protein C8Q73DRAFT_674624 [Cubamyces lactineus]